MRGAGMIGYGLKIAVIDTGINASHPHIFAPTHAVIFDPEETNPSYEDVLGHGTAVTAAIQERAPYADYYILKLLETRCARPGTGSFVRSSGPSSTRWIS